MLSAMVFLCLPIVLMLLVRLLEYAAAREQKERNQNKKEELFATPAYRRSEALKAEQNVMREWEERFDFETNRQVPVLTVGSDGFTKVSGHVSAESLRETATPLQSYQRLMSASEIAMRA